MLVLASRLLVCSRLFAPSDFVAGNGEVSCCARRMKHVTCGTCRSYLHDYICKRAKRLRRETVVKF